MKERLIDRIRRKIREARGKRYKRIIRKYAGKHLEAVKMKKTKK